MDDKQPFNRQRTVYMTEADYNLFPEVAAKLEHEYPNENFKARGEYSLSAVVSFLLKREAGQK